MRNLVTEFGDGKISTEQFNILYERYSNQIAMATEALKGMKPVAQGGDMSTIAIREATTGKALGLGIYHHRSGTIIETLGNFALPPSAMSSVLNEFSDRIESGEYIEPRIQKGAAGMWLVFMARQQTTAIILFSHEPNRMQITQMQKLHHDFETANRRYLDAYNVDPKSLARPFIGFVKKKLGT